MTQAWSNGQWQTYTYDAGGQRVKRNVDGTETWQVYGMGGELLAEYAQQNPSPLSPQKEYGYRNGQLLVEVTAAAASWGSPPVLDDNPLNPHYVGETTVQSRHITQLRTAIDALRKKKRGQACDFAILLSQQFSRLDLAKDDTSNSKSAPQDCC